MLVSVTAATDTAQPNRQSHRHETRQTVFRELHRGEEHERDIKFPGKLQQMRFTWTEGSNSEKSHSLTFIRLSIPHAGVVVLLLGLTGMEPPAPAGWTENCGNVSGASAALNSIRSIVRGPLSVMVFPLLLAMNGVDMD